MKCGKCIQHQNGFCKAEVQPRNVDTPACRYYLVAPRSVLRKREGVK